MDLLVNDHELERKKRYMRSYMGKWGATAMRRREAVKRGKGSSGQQGGTL